MSHYIILFHNLFFLLLEGVAEYNTPGFVAVTYQITAFYLSIFHSKTNWTKSFLALRKHLKVTWILQIFKIIISLSFGDGNT